MDHAQHWQPPDEQVRRVYQPVEIRGEDDTWTVGRINAWWQPERGQPWCRVRTLGGRPAAARWMPFDPDRVTLLPLGGI